MACDDRKSTPAQEKTGDSRGGAGIPCSCGREADPVRQRAAGAIGSSRDRLEDWEARWPGAAEVSGLIAIVPEAVLTVDRFGSVCDANEAAIELAGAPVDELVGARFAHQFSPSEIAERMLAGAFAGDTPREIPLLWTGAHGRRMQVVCSANTYTQGAGFEQRAFVVVRDVTDCRQYEEQLAFQATRDPLTAVLNRMQVRERLMALLRRAELNGLAVCLLLIDLDNFKDVNGAFGHSTGDELLQWFALRVQAVLDEKDVFGRLGGDVFAVARGGIGDLGEVHSLAERLMTLVGDPFFIAGREVALSCSMGITTFPSDGSDADTMLRDADTALHRAKQEGKGRITFFTTEMTQVARRRVDVGDFLRSGLRDSEFLLEYQPRVTLAGKRVAGVEALLRWHSAELGAVSPGEFIPIAEQNGLIIPIGEWVLNTACRQAAEWRERTGVEVNVAVNLSACQLLDTDIVHVVAGALECSGLPAQRLELELTESALIADTQMVMRTLLRLKEIGVRLALDDFGTGYSSLSYLRRLPLDYLKIDRSFVVEIPGNRGDEAIARAIIAMAQGLGLKVIAEGVETERQLEFLAAQGCDEIQGFLMARPMSADRIKELLAG